MKLLIILSVIACSHAAKLDRTYLPPASAASAGGSHDSLRTPVSQSGTAGNFRPSGQTGAFAPSSAGSLAPLGSRGSSGSTGSFRPSESSGSQFGLPNNGAFGKSSGALQPSAPSTQYGPLSGESFNTNFAEPSSNFGSQAQNFGNQAQNYQRNQQKASADINAEILRFDNQNDGETFSYNFETSNGIAAEESGVATNGVQAQGAYSYSDDDGQQFRVAYIADENGYQPQGEHLPTPHPIPEEILKSIEQNARAAAAGTQEGAYNPEEDNSPTSPQAYNYNAPKSYNQGPAGQSSAFNQGSTSSSGTFNQAQEKSPSQTYGAPNAASPSRSQSPQGPSQQYGAPTAGFSPKPQGPAQQYDAFSGSSLGSQRYQGSAQQYKAPHGGSSAGLQGPSQQYGAPDTFPSRSNNLQSPSQQYGAPNAGSAIRQSSFNQQQANTPSTVYGSASNRAARPSNNNGNQEANGFGPSGSAFRPSGISNAQAISNQYQTRPNQYSQPEGSTLSGQAQEQSGYQYNKPQLTNPSFGSANARQGQGQYRPQNEVSQGSQGGFPISSGAGSSDSVRPAFQPSHNYGAAAASNAVGSKGNFGSTSQSSFGSPARPNTQSIGQPQGQSFNQGFRRQQSQMSESGYQYNQPQGSQSFGSRGPQTGFKTAPSQGQTFGAPRQPPSFTEEEGYKY